jgi:hypothetical protein
VPMHCARVSAHATLLAEHSGATHTPDCEQIVRPLVLLLQSPLLVHAGGGGVVVTLFGTHLPSAHTPRMASVLGELPTTLQLPPLLVDAPAAVWHGFVGDDTATQAPATHVRPLAQLVLVHISFVGVVHTLLTHVAGDVHWSSLWQAPVGACVHVPMTHTKPSAQPPRSTVLDASQVVAVVTGVHVPALHVPEISI